MAVTTQTTPTQVAMEPAPERSLATPMERLSALLQKADAASGDARRAATTELNLMLGQMPRYASRPVADQLLRWLDQGSFSDLEDKEGQTARAAATGALLAMGYPYALEISPDDLDHLRERSASGGGLSEGLAALLLLGTSGFGLMEVVRDGALLRNPSHLLPLLAVLASVLGVGLSRSRGSRRRLALLSLLVSGVVAMGFAFTESSALLLPALGAILGFAMAWPRRGS